MSRLKMGFTEVLAAAAARRTPLAAIFLKKPLSNPAPFNPLVRPKDESLCLLAKIEGHAPKPHGWAGARL